MKQQYFLFSDRKYIVDSFNKWCDHYDSDTMQISRNNLENFLVFLYEQGLLNKTKLKEIRKRNKINVRGTEIDI